MTTTGTMVIGTVLDSRKGDNDDVLDSFYLSHVPLHDGLMLNKMYY